MQPPFLSVPVPTAPLDAARAALPGAEPGQVFWRADDFRLECAVVILPDGRAPGLARLALCDALGALGPPYVIPSTVGEEVLVNGAIAGTLEIASRPPLGLIGLTVEVADPGLGDPGLYPERTTLREEGFAEDVDAQGVLDAFLRHLLSHIYRAEHQGCRP